MGFSEYAIVVKNEEDIKEVLKYVKQCNIECDFPLWFGPILKFNDKLYWILFNPEGRDVITTWLQNNLPPELLMSLLYPSAKPDGWKECKDYVWEAEDQLDGVTLYDHEDRINRLVNQVFK
jgi:hypothetical protein